MLYARLNDAGEAFEPQRNLMFHSFGLDGAGSIAADRNGNVYVTWHGIGLSEAKGTGKEGEARRRVWVTRSQDNGKTFSTETRGWAQETGACGCCGMKAFVDGRGEVFALYRSATESVHRDIYLLGSSDHGKTFQGKLLHKWNINACPMSSMDFTEHARTMVCAWETGDQVYWTRIVARSTSDPIAAPGEGKGPKHPRLAVNDRGEVLLAWTEGTGWQKGGSLAYHVYDPAGRPIGDPKQVPGIPTWSLRQPFLDGRTFFNSVLKDSRSGMGAAWAALRCRTTIGESHASSEMKASRGQSIFLDHSRRQAHRTPAPPPISSGGTASSCGLHPAGWHCKPAPSSDSDPVCPVSRFWALPGL